MSTFWAIILFTVGLLLGLLIAWLWLRKRITRCEQESRELRASLEAAEEKAAGLEARVHGKEEAIRGLTAQLEERDEAIGQFEEAIGTRNLQIADLQAQLAPPEPQDLARIEGIGPRISGLLQEAGILTYAQLAAAEVSKLEQILADAGLAHLANPGTWPEQASLAAAEDWAALESLQDRLRGGREA
jgi:predicted flap endonuclease-1-like 5' DNA nuclease